MGPSSTVNASPARTLLFTVSMCHSKRANFVSNRLLATAMKMTQGPPDLPSAILSSALRCAAVAFSSASTIQVTLPRCRGPGECAAHAQESPARGTSPKFPRSMCHTAAPSQKPLVGGALKLQGQPQSQLHPPSSAPCIDHFVAMVSL